MSINLASTMENPSTLLNISRENDRTYLINGFDHKGEINEDICFSQFLVIPFHEGELKQGAMNGVTVEALLRVCIDRLQTEYQESLSESTYRSLADLRLVHRHVVESRL